MGVCRGPEGIDSPEPPPAFIAPMAVYILFGSGSAVGELIAKVFFPGIPGTRVACRYFGAKEPLGAPRGPLRFKGYPAGRSP